MNEIDSLWEQFQNTSEQSTPLMWGETTSEKPTPSSEDGERLEQSIRDVFSNKQLLNKALATFLGVFTANAGVSLLTTLGISAIASGTLSSIVLGLFFANTLTKIQYDGRIHIGKDFMVATAQTASVGATLWVAFDEYRMVSNATNTGKTRFYSEVRQYEVKPSPQTDTPWLMIGLAALGVLLLAAMTRGRNQ
ncbi:hypothetical protein [Nostoc sp. 'Peltigera membranacea cyanobiont' 232]|uniref:hypothetical protein n=1 Tax=Nostoc sp. 'Peltigera membranacea cyanobiont' 232 TaxID=2014531 RepID=UPI000B95688B|nr:hypothetical protein [Nostoc sp. 'Peltigera membranacea cyanobiont' 232]OYD99923.1 hypothetical protein CDG79_38130 [Nostoc sp. 'Peltigera membranacea cyanobiont' 232]